MKTLKIEIRLSEEEYRDAVEQGLCNALAERDWTDSSAFKWELSE